MTEQVKSKQRVNDYGEVLTDKKEVNDMLGLVKVETERIDSRFLEPACGTGNFLSEILERKLRVVASRYGKSQFDYERYAILVFGSIYGVDILEDNIEECRRRLFDIFDRRYTELFGNAVNERCRASIKYILGRNIIWGDALSLMTVCGRKQPIVFSEWSLVNGSMLKRRDFKLSYLLDQRKQRLLFDDYDEEVRLSDPVREFPLIHFLEVSNTDEQ